MQLDGFSNEASKHAFEVLKQKNLLEFFKKRAILRFQDHLDWPMNKRITRLITDVEIELQGMGLQPWQHVDVIWREVASNIVDSIL